MVIRRPVFTMKNFLNRLLKNGGKIDEVYYNFSSEGSRGNTRKILYYDEAKYDLRVVEVGKNRRFSPDLDFLEHGYHMKVSRYRGDGLLSNKGVLVTLTSRNL